MNYQIVNKTKSDIDINGQIVKAGTSTTLHASFVSDEFVKNNNIDKNVIIVSEKEPEKEPDDGLESLSDEELKELAKEQGVSLKKSFGKREKIIEIIRKG